MSAANAQKHVRAVSPLAFPDSRSEDQVLRRSQRHTQLCMAMIQILRAVVMTTGNVGGPKNAPPPMMGTIARDKLVYFRANDPSRFISPDAFVKLGTVFAEDSASWKSWERGAPDLAFEILSPNDSGEAWPLEEKIARYAELGVRELVVFDVDDPPGHRLRVWDRVDGDFVERVVEDERTPCLTLGLDMTVAPVVIDEQTQYPACVRLLRANNQIVASTTEAQMVADKIRREADQALQDKEAAEVAAAEASMTGAQSQRAEAQARGEAKARAAELEAQRARERAGRNQ